VSILLLQTGTLRMRMHIILFTFNYCIFVWHPQLAILCARRLHCGRGWRRRERNHCCTAVPAGLSPIRPSSWSIRGRRSVRTAATDLSHTQRTLLANYYRPAGRSFACGIVVARGPHTRDGLRARARARATTTSLAATVEYRYNTRGTTETKTGRGLL